MEKKNFENRTYIKQVLTISWTKNNFKANCDRTFEMVLVCIDGCSSLDIAPIFKLLFSVGSINIGLQFSVKESTSSPKTDDENTKLNFKNNFGGGLRH